MSGISWHKFRVPTSGTLVQVDNGHFQAIFGPYPAILMDNIVCLPNFDVWNWFLYTRRVQKYYRKQWKKIQWRGLPREKISQKWPTFHYFSNCGHIKPKHRTKIDTDHISVMMNMCVKLEKNLRGYFLEIFKMAKMAQLAIKWPKLKNDYFLLKK